ncbi:MAG: hypothetical protein K2Q09_03015 [Phycisphaerales bacterium]|nr:hypothetical protein [Phycisphaerales bacterium]
MHLVTKILIVFAALFAVLLAALAMAFSYNAQTLRESIDAERAQRQAMTISLNESQTAWQKELATAKTASEQSAGELQTLRTDLANARNERAKLLNDVQAAQLNAARSEATSAGKDQRIQTLSSLSANLQDENAKLRADYLRQSKELTDLMVRLSDLESQNQVLTQNVRSLQEQMADMANAATRKVASAADTRAGTEMATGPLVSAKVSKTAKAPSGEDLAYITAGSAAGLKPGQALNIVRGNKFIARLVILTADVNEAVGRIDTLNTGNSVMADDTVFSRVQ